MVMLDMFYRIDGDKRIVHFQFPALGRKEYFELRNGLLVNFPDLALRSDFENGVSRIVLRDKETSVDVAEITFGEKVPCWKRKDCEYSSRDPFRELCSYVGNFGRNYDLL